MRYQSLRVLNFLRAGLLVAVAMVSAVTLPAAEQARAAAAKSVCSDAVYFYQLNPASANLASKMIACLKARNRLEQAAAEFRKAAEKPGAPVEAWKFAAESYVATGRDAEAQNAYEKYLQRVTGDLGGRMDFAALLVRKKDYAAAQAQYESVLKQKSGYAPATNALARVLSWQGKNDESLALYEKVLAKSPRDIEARTGKASLLLWMNRPEEAQTMLSALKQEYPKDTAIAESFERARAASEAKVLAAARQAGQTGQVEAYHRKRLADNPNDVMSLRAMAELASGPQRCSENIGYRRKVLELTPSDPRSQSELAQALATCNQFDEAIQRFRQFMQAYPKNEGVAFAQANTLRRAGRLSEAVEVFRAVLDLNTKNLDARLGLAMSLASSGSHQEALLRYDEVLAVTPNSYEAQQGKASVLFWTGQLKASRAIFETLAAQRPDDALNTTALKQIAGAEEDARWAAIRPQPKAPLEDWQKYYEKRLAAYPNDMATMKGLAYVFVQLKSYPAAVQAYRNVLASYPNDRSSQLELARLLSWDGKFDESIGLYNKAIEAQPDDVEAIESLARVEVWAGQPQEALKNYQLLLAKQPTNKAYQLELARLQLRLKDTPAAREFLTAILAADPKNREAQLLLAQMNLNQGNYDTAIYMFDQVLKQDSKDSSARFGKARSEYYKGEMSRAYQVTSALVKDEPDNVDALFLLASLERARANRSAALALLNETLKRSPNHTEAAAMKKSLLESEGITLHTTASFVREIGKAGLVEGDPQSLNEDLRAFTYGVALGFEALPRTSSTLSMTVMPSNTPFGGLRGAVGPSQFFYRQSTTLSRNLSVRAGAGLVRFGSGALVSIPGQPDPLPSAELTPVAMAGLTYSPTKKIRLDIGFNRSGITYTPTSVRLGVVQHGIGASANFTLTPRTTLFLSYDHGWFHSREYEHVIFTNGLRAVDIRSDSDTMHRGSIYLNRSLFRSDRFSLDLGYSGVMYGNPGPAIFLGFFNPGFTQSHLFVGRTSVKLAGPVRFNFQGGAGAQQTDDESTRRGLQASPSFSVRVNSRFSFTVGYTHYNTAQTLSTLKGNAYYVTTDWRF